MNALIHELRQELKKNVDHRTRASGQRFFKEKVNLYGIKTARVRKIAAEFFNRIKELEKREIFGLCEELWRSGMLEESFIACHWSYRLRGQFQPDDFDVFAHWVNNYVSNWASCDTLCNHTIGSFLELYPRYLEDLKKWAGSNNRWVRRAAAVSLVVPARHGKFLNEIFGIADLLLLDGDDLVRKGYGWMLKAASQAHQQEVLEYVMKNKAFMPRTALRYAIEKMPPELRKKAMEK